MYLGLNKTSTTSVLPRCHPEPLHRRRWPHTTVPRLEALCGHCLVVGVGVYTASVNMEAHKHNTCCWATQLLQCSYDVCIATSQHTYSTHTHRHTDTQTQTHRHTRTRSQHKMSMTPSMNDTDTEHGTWQTRTRATRDQPLQHPPRRPQARQPLLPAPPLALGSCFAFVHEHEPPSEPQPVRPAELRPLASASRRRGWRHRVCSRTCGDGRWCTQQRVRRGIAAVGGASGQAKGKGTRVRTLPPDVHEPSRFPHT